MLLKNIRLQNFKCFRDQTVELAPLTILSGINGMGKSSVIQAILVMRQTAHFHAQLIGQPKVLLNGPLINLGQPKDVLFDGAEIDDVTLSLFSALTEESESSSSNETTRKYQLGWFLNGDIIEDDYDVTALDGWPPGRIQKFAYLCAERLGPRIFQPVSPPATINRIGNAGEFCAHILAQNESKPVSCKKLLRKRPGEENILKGLKDQTEIWLSKIGHKVQIRVIKHASMDLVNLEFSFLHGCISTKKYRSTNVGFGLSYVLPIFVAVLSAEPGDLIIIENPEAHLHPKGQTIMGDFLAIAASCGIQVIIETHSDHLLNGVRLAVKKGKLNGQEVALNFFNYDEDSEELTVETPAINKDGRLDSWPENFFDEWEKTLMELL